jgi:manganese transport protein
MHEADHVHAPAARGARAAATVRPGGVGRWLAFLGPAILVSVGYMDPGNWATDLEGGARFGYSLLWVLIASSVVAMLLQMLSARLGIVSGLDLATACRMHYPRGLATALWLLAEVAIVACDMAEILGSAVALKLLFGIPMLIGALLTAADVFVILLVQTRSGRVLQTIVLGLLLAVALCLGAQLFLAAPPMRSVIRGIVPRLENGSLYVAIGILGATVMPHNLYLHSALVPRHLASRGRPEALRISNGSTALALNIALVVNAAILILAAVVFSSRGIAVTDLRDAQHLLRPLTGSASAAVLFALGLLCAGQSATITGTLAGQIVMEGFMQRKLSALPRRMLTRGLAIVPAVLVLASAGERSSMSLLIASQVVLSLQLPFAIVPLVRFTNSRQLMGSLANRRGVRVACAVCALLVIAANSALVARTALDLRRSAPLGAALLFAAGSIGLALLGYIALVPLRRTPTTATRSCAPSPRARR